MWLVYSLTLGLISIGLISYGIYRRDEIDSASEFSPVPGLILLVFSLQILFVPVSRSISTHPLIHTILNLILIVIFSLFIYISMLKIYYSKIL